MGGLLAPGEQREILQEARHAIVAALDGRPAQAPPLRGVFARPAGVFVSLHNHGELRGCIGHPDGDQPLGSVVGHCAVAAACEDPRFPSVTRGELDEIDIEVSVLGPIEPVHQVEEIEVGRHGLIAEQSWHRGLLLPQVATEHGWTRDVFLTQTCLKAGLRPDAWKHGARLFRFEAEVFGENPGA